LRREDSSRSTAQIYYLLGLIAHGRTQDAVKVAEQFRRDDSVYVPETAIRDMERAGFAPQMNDFFAALLKQNPELPFWRQYVELAAHAGKTSEMVALVQTNLARTTLSKNQRLELEQLLHTALLADDQIDAGVAELRQLMQASTKAGSRRSWSQPQPEALALELAQIGRLLERTNWFEEGIAAAQRTAEDAQQPESWGGGEIAVANLLVKMNRGQEAEAVLAKALAKSSPAEEGMGSSSARILIGLVRLYHQAGRYSDVLYLFDNAPQWGAKDLKDVNGYSMDWDELRSRVSHATVETPVGFYAASAVAKTGRTNEARKLLDASLDEAPGCDRLYELLLSVEGDQAPARLDTLFARDPFEERPLIWKAHWLRTHGRLEEAE
jgi:tetratricopeptide (TPR) repeat protein